MTYVACLPQKISDLDFGILELFFWNFNPIWGVKLSRRDWRQLFQEEIVQESVIYQDILQKGRQQEALALIRCEQLQKLMRKSAANVQ